MGGFGRTACPPPPITHATNRIIVVIRPHNIKGLAVLLGFSLCRTINLARHKLSDRLSLSSRASPIPTPTIICVQYNLRTSKKPLPRYTFAIACYILLHYVYLSSTHPIPLYIYTIINTCISNDMIITIHVMLSAKLLFAPCLSIYPQSSLYILFVSIAYYILLYHLSTLYCKYLLQSNIISV